MALVSLLPHCDNQEKLALLNLFSLMAKDNPLVRCLICHIKNSIVNHCICSFLKPAFRNYANIYLVL